MMNLAQGTLDLAQRLLKDRLEKTEEARVVEHIERREPISENASERATKNDTFWDRLADSVALVGGSWPFIGFFILFMILWNGIHGFVLEKGSAFDPYSYVFLNLILSMLAAIQAPIIMMRQNRQAGKDRVAAADDYGVNPRSELEILGMQEKLDRLLGEQHDVLVTNQADIMSRIDRIEQIVIGLSSAGTGEGN